MDKVASTVDEFDGYLSLSGWSPRHHARVNVLSDALLAAVGSHQRGTNPSTGTVAVACALWRRELAQLTG